MYYTDDRGIYRVYGLSPGQYTVSVGSSGADFQVFIKPRKLPLTFYPGVSDASRAKAIDVTAGNESAGIDIKVGAAEKGFSITGVVIDGETRKPVPNALVMFERASTPAPSDTGESESVSSPAGVSTASSKGEFKFDSMAPGRYTLQAGSIGMLSGTTEFYSDRAQVEIKNGNADKLEVKVHRGASISGVVILEDSDDPEVRAQLAQLKLTAYSDSPSGESSHSIASVDVDGVFRFAGLRAGKTEIGLVTYLGPKGFQIRRVEGDVVSDGAVYLQPNQQVTGVRLFLVHGSGVIHGQVFVAGDQKQLHTRLLVTSHLRGGVGIGASASVDSKGFFTIENLAPGDYEVTVSLFSGLRADVPGTFQASALQVVTVTNDATSEVTFTIDPKSKGNQ